MRPKISVIIPIYNQENYLHRSLESVACQTFSDYEVLLINDGSTDSSAAICHKYCAKYESFRLISKANGGVASARQCGLDNSVGNYVIHIDPDDYVEPDFLESLYLKAISSQADVVICDYWEEFSNETSICTHSHINSSSPNDLLTSIVEGKTWGVLWNKLIKTDCIRGKIAFEAGINFHEDKLFLVRALRNSIQKVEYILRPLYHYNRKNVSSILTQTRLTKDSIMQVWKVYELIIAEEPDKKKQILQSQQLVKTSYLLDIWLRPDFSQREFLRLIKPMKRGLRKKIINEKTLSVHIKLVLIFFTFITSDKAKSIFNHIIRSRTL